MWENNFKVEENGLKIEANYNSDSIKSKSFKFTIDNKSVIVEREFIYQLLVLFGNEKQQEEMIDVKNVKMKTMRRLLRIKAKKNIKKDEMIEVAVDFPVSADVYNKVQTFRPFALGNMEKDPMSVSKII